MNIKTIDNFIDDFYIIHMFKSLKEASDFFEIYVEEMKTFGFQISTEKLVYPSKDIKMLGRLLIIN